MNTPLKLAVVGVGRIGVFHAQHVQELAQEENTCELVAVVDTYGDTARRVAEQLQPRQQTPIRAFDSTEALAAAGLVNAALIASRTEDHDRDARVLIDAGCRILLEKPLTHSLESAAELARHLNADPARRRALMQAFMRRFDPPLLWARDLLLQKRIGTPFKTVSVLEDPIPPPDGYNSPGLLPDMAVHNIDETIWLLGVRPRTVDALGANLHNFRISPVKEDYDDAFLQMGFPQPLIAQIQVSRNHVAGYRNETWVYGDGGLIHVGHFRGDPLAVTAEAYSPGGIIEKRSFQLRDYGPNVPVFIQRFGPAYKAELAYFVRQCIHNRPFSVTHQDGLNAIAVAQAGLRALQNHRAPIRIDYPL